MNLIYLHFPCFHMALGNVSQFGWASLISADRTVRIRSIVLRLSPVPAIELCAPTSMIPSILKSIISWSVCHQSKTLPVGQRRMWDHAFVRMRQGRRLTRTVCKPLVFSAKYRTFLVSLDLRAIMSTKVDCDDLLF